MKKITFLIVSLFIANIIFAQQGINYKAIITDGGSIVQSQTVDIKFTILENGTTSVYQETHTVNTDENGILIVNVGEGSVLSGNYSTINWTEEQFLKVEINTGNGFTDMGTTAFKAVPYAKNADNTTRFEGKTLAEIKAEIKAELDIEKFNDILARLDALEDKTASMSVVTQHGVPTVRFSAVNLQVVSGSGTTAGAINGSGNLIVGYNALGATKTGSHNLIVGEYQNYSSYGGVVFGYYNTISERYSSVLGGTSNTASGYYTSVTGGDHNQAIADKSSITGGAFNIANNINSFIGGGYYNEANANYSSILGGNENITSGIYSVILGGRSNSASGSYSSVSAGRDNTASGFSSSVSAGQHNLASGDYSSVSGGGSIYESFGNTAQGNHSTISGGGNRTVTDDLDWKAGTLFEDN